MSTPPGHVGRVDLLEARRAQAAACVDAAEQRPQARAARRPLLDIDARREERRRQAPRSMVASAAASLPAASSARAPRAQSTPRRRRAAAAGRADRCFNTSDRSSSVRIACGATRSISASTARPARTVASDDAAVRPWRRASSDRAARGGPARVQRQRVGVVQYNGRGAPDRAREIAAPTSPRTRTTPGRDTSRAADGGRSASADRTSRQAPAVKALSASIILRGRRVPLPEAPRQGARGRVASIKRTGAALGLDAHLRHVDGVAARRRFKRARAAPAPVREGDRRPSRFALRSTRVRWGSRPSSGASSSSASPQPISDSDVNLDARRRNRRGAAPPRCKRSASAVDVQRRAAVATARASAPPSVSVRFALDGRGGPAGPRACRR